jgi:hypothetical protein
MKLLNLFNWVESLVSFFTLNVGGGGGGSPAPAGPQTSTNTSYSTNLPEYAQPYYTELMKQASKAVYSTDPSGNVTGVAPYQQFGGSTQLAGGAMSAPGQRIAGFTPGQQAVQQQVANLQTPGQFGAANFGLGAGSQLGLGAGLQGLSQAFNYNPQAFSTGAANYYANPYQQGVTDIALREARQQGDIQKQQGALGAIGRGTFGGARQALMQAEQGRNLNRQLSDIQTQGSQQGYQNAQAQFNADQARQQQYATTLGQLGMSGLTAGLQGSQALGALGSQQQTADLARLQAQDVSSAQQQALQQQQLNQAYQDYQTAYNYPKSQIEYLNNILRGNAGALGSTQVAYTPAPSNASQLASLGLAGLGLYSALGKGLTG